MYKMAAVKPEVIIPLSHVLREGCARLNEKRLDVSEKETISIFQPLKTNSNLTIQPVD
jgi:hypothetical protein